MGTWLSSTSTRAQKSGRSNTSRTTAQRPSHLDRGAAALLGRPEDERDAGAVDQVVHDAGGDDLATQRVRVDPVAVPLHDRRREVPPRDRAEVRLVGQAGGEQLALEGHLRVRDQHRELRRRQPQPGGEPGVDLAVGRQELQRAVELAALLEVADQPLVHRQHRVRLDPGVAEQDVLLVVVAQDVRGDVVGHRREQVVALLGREVAGAHDLVEQDLDVDLVVGGVDPGRVVDGVGVEPDAALGGLDPAALGEAEVAALADHPARRSQPSIRIASLALSPTSALDSRRRLHVRADAAVPEQVDRCREDRLHQLGRGQLVDAVGDAERRADLRAHRDRLGRPRVDPAAGRDQRVVVVVPGRARQVEQPAPLRERRGRVRRRGRGRCAGGRRRPAAGCARRAACRCRTRRRTCRRRRRR